MTHPTPRVFDCHQFKPDACKQYEDHWLCPEVSVIGFLRQVDGRLSCRGLSISREKRLLKVEWKTCKVQR